MTCSIHGDLAFHSGACWMCESLEERKARVAGMTKPDRVVKKKIQEEVVLPSWLAKKPATKRQKAEMIRYCRQMNLDLPSHLL